ncbi:MAG: hypothetical protein M1817_001938 [Caeruleum heppii]|nr:MAG: hypothetical protein M1817_001938 [Caeruleum heppii]
MPLHLLGKKSWNVYNADNIARVRQDEARAQAREEEEERRMQEVDAARRMQILRGLSPEPSSTLPEPHEERSHRRDSGREKKRRRIAGEDDTDRDIRLAQETSALVTSKTTLKSKEETRSKTSDAPLTDHAGHINLFPEERTSREPTKNAEEMADRKKKERELEDQYTMRFSNAAGFKQSLENPWYSSLSKRQEEGQDPMPQVGKDVWGNEDPGRKEREKRRLTSGDPLASMKRGVKDLKQMEVARKKWVAEKEMELRRLKQAESESRRRRRKDDEGLNGFSLDGPTHEAAAGGRDDHGRRSRHHHKDDGITDPGVQTREKGSRQIGSTDIEATGEGHGRLMIDILPRLHHSTTKTVKAGEKDEEAAIAISFCTRR